jgi:hypothetical protein
VKVTKLGQSVTDANDKNDSWIMAWFI